MLERNNRIRRNLIKQLDSDSIKSINKIPGLMDELYDLAINSTDDIQYEHGILDFQLIELLDNKIMFFWNSQYYEIEYDCDIHGFCTYRTPQ